ncbi:MAG: hypothetical protein AAGA56_04995 [Myxococcota bacterium]
MKFLTSLLLVVGLALVPGCSDDDTDTGDEGGSTSTDGGSNNNNGQTTTTSSEMNCSSAFACINGACGCGADGSGEMCDNPEDMPGPNDCDTVCEVCE